MMLELLKSWKGAVEIDGTEYEDIGHALNACKTLSNVSSIKLYAHARRSSQRITDALNSKSEYRVTVKQYMTKEASPEFDFMAKWNNNNPMPLRTMIGTVEKETRGMVYMKLHGDIYAEKICTCMKCGRPLTNPVSQFFGIGPECGGHNYVNPFDSEEELKAAVSAYKAQLQKITWEGWIIKSAIIEREEIKW